MFLRREGDRIIMFYWRLSSIGVMSESYFGIVLCFQTRLFFKYVHLKVDGKHIICVVLSDFIFNGIAARNVEVARTVDA